MTLPAPFFLRYRCLFLLPSLILLMWFQACNPCDSPDCDDPPVDTSTDPSPYNFALKPHFASIDPVFDNTPTDNPSTNEGVELGRFLFYDKRLSKNNTISCASCHRQENAFSDPDRFSLGYEGGRTGRHSMSIVNMRWHGLFFWDGRASTLEEQVLMPIQDHIEMGMPLEGLVGKLRDIDQYPPLFEKAFGDRDIQADRISKALAQFVRTIVSQNSKFDDLYGLPESKIKAQLSPQEYLGYRLFTTHVDPDYGSGKNEPGTIFRGANCGDCHKTQLLTNNLITNNGLDSVTKDPGYGKVSGVAKYDGAFKTPTLRNVALTAPYMHDGRFATLREVIVHYDQHVKPHPNLDYQISEAGNTLPGRLDLTDDEIDALLAFLETLTDHDLLKDPRYANPFE